MRGALRLATRGLSGIVVFLAGMFGYALGGGLVLSGLLKPIFPRNAGVWVRDGHVVSMGTLVPAPEGAHQILGNWYIVIALIAGSLLLWATMYLIRNTLRLSRAAQMRSSPLGRRGFCRKVPGSWKLLAGLPFSTPLRQLATLLLPPLDAVR